MANFDLCQQKLLFGMAGSFVKKKGIFWNKSMAATWAERSLGKNQHPSPPPFFFPLQKNYFFNY